MRREDRGISHAEYFQTNDIETKLAALKVWPVQTSFQRAQGWGGGPTNTVLASRPGFVSKVLRLAFDSIFGM